MATRDELLATDEQNVLGLGGLIALAPVILAAAHAEESGRIALLEQRSLRKWHPTLLTLPEMAEMLRRGQLDIGAYRREMERLGYSGDRIDHMLSLVPPLFDANTLGELSRRGKITDAQYRDNLHKLGYDDEQVDRLNDLKLYIPGPQDVISFANRDVYYPDVVEQYGMLQDFPEAMIPDLEKAGVTREQGLKFWAAHWSLPSMQQAFEMLQRDAETGLTAQDINRLMRSAGVEPYWRPKLLAISYAPYTRVDIRRMHKTGILNREQVVRAYKDIGYNAERAEQLTAFTEKLNGADSNAEAAKLHVSLRTKARSLYEESVLDADGLRDVYLALGYTAEDAEAFVQEAEFVRVANVRKEQRDAIKAMYVKGIINDADAQQRLSALSYDGATIVRVIEPWHLAREARERSPEEHKERDLTRADIIGAYVDTIIKRDDAAQMLGLLGYDAHEVEVILQRSDFAQAKAERTAIEHAVHAQFMARRIDKSSAISALGQGKVSQQRTTYLIAEWEMELDARAPMLTVAQISSALKAGLIPDEDAATRFDAHGYSIDDRNILIALAKGSNSVGQ